MLRRVWLCASARPTAAARLQLRKAVTTASVAADTITRPWTSAAEPLLPPPVDLPRPRQYQRRGRNGKVARRPQQAAPPRPQKLRVGDPDVVVLLSARSSPKNFDRAVRALRNKDEIALLAATDVRAWSMALQRRLENDDEYGAAQLLGLVASFARENANEQLWTDLLFTLLRQRSRQPDYAAEMEDLLDRLCDRYGPHFVARVVVAVVNGCANLNMLAQARLLVLYHQNLQDTTRATDSPTDFYYDSSDTLMPPSIVGHLLSRMTSRKQFADALQFATELFAHDQFHVARDFQQQGFLALFAACAAEKRDLKRVVRWYLDYVSTCVAQSGGDVAAVRALVLERGFGAAIQSCVKLEEYALAVHCYATMEQMRHRVLGGDDLTAGLFADDVVDEGGDESGRVVDDVLPADENVYVNVMTACKALKDVDLLKQTYRAMAARGLARSAGFGSAIRYCHAELDANFLEEVLDQVFVTEDEMQGAWMLEVENYNDALGCFAATKQFEQAKELFSRMLHNPFVVPDHITMLEMVENYREASFDDIFHLMDVFLERGLTPNLQVFTSLLSTCMRRRVVSDAVALMAAMKQRGVVPDVKAFTTIGFIHATHGDLKAVVGVLQDMATQGIATDQLFFDYVLNGLYGSCGIDMCFSLFRELREANLPTPEGLYVALIDLGTNVGLIERTLHIAYNMECEGFQLSSEQLHKLVLSCRSNAELSELLRTFLLLHQGEQPATPRFQVDVYEDLVAVLTRFNRKDAIPKVNTLAMAAGHNDLMY
ncbi:hypothetical protein BBJ28_00009559 [Nothophytophthora sp. Chile5]|nr:hypothetical protein BBJ28_00009559 [Nothophytophthora sp. Chile5]